MLGLLDSKIEPRKLMAASSASIAKEWAFLRERRLLNVSARG
jgi:hypothetical protein